MFNSCFALIFSLKLYCLRWIATVLLKMNLQNHILTQFFGQILQIMMVNGLVFWFSEILHFFHTKDLVVERILRSRNSGLWFWILQTLNFWVPLDCASLLMEMALIEKCFLSLWKVVGISIKYRKMYELIQPTFVCLANIK